MCCYAHGKIKKNTYITSITREATRKVARARKKARKQARREEIGLASVELAEEPIPGGSKVSYATEIDTKERQRKRKIKGRKGKSMEARTALLWSNWRNSFQWQQGRLCDTDRHKGETEKKKDKRRTGRKPVRKNGGGSRNYQRNPFTAVASHWNRKKSQEILGIH